MGGRGMGETGGGELGAKWFSLLYSTLFITAATRVLESSVILKKM